MAAILNTTFTITQKIEGWINGNSRAKSSKMTILASDF